MSPHNKLPHKRLNLDRFKKSGQGLVEFATLIEQADPKQAETILEAARSVDPEFVHQALRKIVYFEEIIHIDENILAEILSQTSPKLLAFALYDKEESFQQHILRHLSLTDRRAVLDETEKMGKVSKPFIIGAQKHILRIGRELEAKGVLIFEAVDCPRLNPKKKKA